MADPLDRTKRTLQVSVAILAWLLVVGTVGFRLAGDEQRTLFDALWLTVHILTTVGDHAMGSGSLTDRIWAVILMLCGVMVVFYVGINLVAFIVEGEVRRMLGRRRLDNKPGLTG